MCVFCGMEDHEIYWKAAHLSSGSSCFIVMLASYFFSRPLGASQVSSWVTVNTDYELSFDKMNHRFRRLSHIILKTSPSVGTVNPPRWLPKVDIGPSSRQINRSAAYGHHHPVRRHAESRRKRHRCRSVPIVCS